MFNKRKTEKTFKKYRLVYNVILLYNGTKEY